MMIETIALFHRFRRRGVVAAVIVKSLCTCIEVAVILRELVVVGRWF